MEKLAKKLRASGIHTLRQLGRAVGVYSPTNKNKDELIDGILAIASNRADPAEVSRRGAPPKSESYDRELLAEVESCRRYCAGFSSVGERPQNEMSVSSPCDGGEESICSGILEYDDKRWYIRTRGMLPSPEDVIVGSELVTRCGLRTGDMVVCRAGKDGEGAKARIILSVNGLPPEELVRASFEGLTPCYPDRRLTLEYKDCSLSERVIDLFCPIGRGQRALISAPAGAGKTTLLRHIAGAIKKNHPSVALVSVLVDERPEEVTDFRRVVGDGVIVCSPFDDDDVNHVRAAALALEHAKRLAECGRDVVLIVDSLTRLVRVYRGCAPARGSMPAEAEGLAIMAGKHFFGAARNTEEGGSLTIVASVVAGAGNAFDGSICDEFAPAANMRLVLSGELAGGRIFPAVDIAASGSRKEELLLTSAELSAAAAVRSAIVRGASLRDVLQAMQSAGDNASFISQTDKITERLLNDR